MTKAIQIKSLAVILGVLVIIAFLLARGGRPVTLTPADRQTQQKLDQKMRKPRHKNHIVP